MRFIGIDIGTSSICGIIYDSSGHLTETIRIKNNAGIQSKNDWNKIQDPEWILNIVKDIIKTFELKYSEIHGIGITGQMHGILYLDEQGNALSPLYTWQDKSGNQVFNNGTTYADYLTSRSGYKLATGYGLVTHFYQLQKAGLPNGAIKICTIMDYVVMKLVQKTNPVTDCSNAASLGFFNISEGKFDTVALHKAGINPNILPEIKASASPAGYYHSRIPVFVAIGDNQASFIGSVKDKKHSIHISIGTSSQLSIYSDELVQIDALETRPFPGGGYIVVGAALSGGQSLAVLQTFFETVVSLFDGDPKAIDFFETINHLEYKKNTPFDIKVKTSFNGSRVDPFLNGGISNISSGNFSAESLIYGFMEGICNEIFNFYTLIPETLKKNENVLIGSGNGIKQNKLLCTTLEKKFDLPLIKSEYEEDAAWGACKVAMVGAGHLPGF